MLQWRSQEFEMGEEVMAGVPSTGNFYNFSIKVTHFYAYFDQNSYFKAVTHQNHLESSLNVLNSINEIQVL